MKVTCPVLPFITARKRSLRRLCFYTCLSVHRGRGSNWTGTPPETGTPPRLGTPLRPGTPLDQVPPRPGTPPDQVHPPSVHAGRYGQQVVSTHPTGMHSCLKICLHVTFFSPWPFLLPLKFSVVSIETA